MTVVSTHWHRTTLGQLCDSHGGELQTGPFGSQLHAKDYVDDGVPLVMPRDLAAGGIDDTRAARVSDEDARRLSQHRLVAGDVVFSRRGDVGRFGIVSEVQVGWLCGTGCLRARLGSAPIERRFLHWWLLQPVVQAWFSENAQGATMPNLNTSILARVPVAFPPIAEQRRIAAILDEADALRRKRREALGLLDDLLRSAFLEMFGDPVTNPRGWPHRTLRTVISAIDAGWSSSGMDRPAVPGEWGVLKVSAVSTGLFLADENKAVEDPEFAKPPIVPRRGDLLFSRANTRELVAATCLVDADVEGLYLPDKLWRISCFADVAVVEWLRFLLADGAFRATLTKQATGTSGSMLNVSQDKLLDLVAPIPPIDAQRPFAEFVWATMNDRRRVAEGVRATETLFDSLLHRAFAGEL